MLPNWLYGKSKSKLAELLGGGGTPSDYNQVKAQVTQNTEDIASLDDTKAALTQISNPNLLDNPWFTVNQRGQSSYSGTAGYSYDRWYRQHSGITVSLDSDGCIVIQNTDSSYANFKQSFSEEFIKAINGRTLTLSVLFKDGTINSNTSQNIDLSQNGSYCSVALADGTWANIRSASLSSVSLQIAVAGNTIIPAIRAIKLELGSVSTLAMDTAPDYATELLKCQRYFQRYASKSSQSAAYLGMYYRDSIGANVVIDLPANMRTTPTITLTSTLNVEIASGSKEISAIGSITPNEACNKLKLTSLTMDSQPAGTVGIVTLAGNNYIDFSAEL